MQVRSALLLLITALLAGSACSGDNKFGSKNGARAKKDESAAPDKKIGDQTAGDKSQSAGGSAKSSDEGVNEPVMVAGAFLACAIVEMPKDKELSYYACRGADQQNRSNRTLHWDVVDTHNQPIREVIIQDYAAGGTFDKILALPARLREFAKLVITRVDGGKSQEVSSLALSQVRNKIFVAGISDTYSPADEPFTIQEGANAQQGQNSKEGTSKVSVEQAFRNFLGAIGKAVNDNPKAKAPTAK